MPRPSNEHVETHGGSSVRQDAAGVTLRVGSGGYEFMVE